MKTSHLTPSKLRAILGICMVLLLAAGVGLFAFGYGILADYSAEARTTAAQAQANSSILQDLQKTKTELETNSKTVDRASRIVAESKSYVYQDQIIREINNFADQSGTGADNSAIVVTNISFADAKVTPTSVSAPTASTIPTAGGATSDAVLASPVGVKSMTATVTLKNPVNFASMLKFIRSIEGSLFKMRISQVALSRAAEAQDINAITSDALTIEVYVR